MKPTPFQQQLPLPAFKSDQPCKGENHHPNGRPNKVDPKDRAFHDWYRFVLSFPPHLVSGYIKSFGLGERHVILDPFCGTGTTLVESKLRGITGIGVEANDLLILRAPLKLTGEWTLRF